MISSFNPTDSYMVVLFCPALPLITQLTHSPRASSQEKPGPDAS